MENISGRPRKHSWGSASRAQVGDYKLLLGTIGLAYWQGHAFPNGTDCAPGTPDNARTPPRDRTPPPPPPALLVGRGNYLRLLIIL
jgi:hypothetical protein